MTPQTAFSIFVVALVSVCLFGTSFSVLHPLEMALKYNENIHLLHEGTVYGAHRGDSGRFFTGFNIHFLKFPKELQQVEFSDHTQADYPRMIVRTGPDSYTDTVAGVTEPAALGMTSACSAGGGREAERESV